MRVLKDITVYDRDPLMRRVCRAQMQLECLIENLKTLRADLANTAAALQDMRGKP